jgi:hypothetical protein
LHQRATLQAAGASSCFQTAHQTWKLL